MKRVENILTNRSQRIFSPRQIYVFFKIGHSCIPSDNFCSDALFTYCYISNEWVLADDKLLNRIVVDDTKTIKLYI